MKDELREYDLKVRYNDSPDAEPIDIIIYDDEDNVAFLWGSNPFNDVQVECNHPTVEFDDDETVGECPICGATCTWHWQTSGDDGYTITERVVDSWEKPKEIGGILGRYIKELKERF